MPSRPLPFGGNEIAASAPMRSSVATIGPKVRRDLRRQTDVQRGIVADA